MLNFLSDHSTVFPPSVLYVVVGTRPRLGVARLRWSRGGAGGTRSDRPSASPTEDRDPDVRLIVLRLRAGGPTKLFRGGSNHLQ